MRFSSVVTPPMITCLGFVALCSLDVLPVVSDTMRSKIFRLFHCVIVETIHVSAYNIPVRWSFPDVTHNAVYCILAITRVLVSRRYLCVGLTGLICNLLNAE